MLQLLVLFIAAGALPVALPYGWEPPAGRNPMLWLLAVLTVGVGVPFFAVATQGPVLQRWFASSGHRAGRDPCFLYAASNLGSLAALIAYPTIFEPLMRSCDVLVVDAFRGDAIPVHLLTRQAMSIYLDKLDRRGMLAFHISNMYLDPLPICSALAADAGCVGVYRNDLDVSPAEAAEGKSASQWVVIARDKSTLAKLANDPRWRALPSTPATRVWTDDFSNILSVFRWR
ncbi:MAG: hypothetical protein ABSC42_10280 [Tepidisphaeraceae bacterium]